MIVKLSQENLTELLPLWQAYQEFYQVADIDPERNRKHIQHILDTPSEGQIYLYRLDNQYVGFCTLYYTYASTAAARVALLNDLFVQSDYQKKGIGKELLEHAVAMTREMGIPQIRWMTQESNQAAQKLYRNYVQPSEWLLYSIKT